MNKISKIIFCILFIMLLLAIYSYTFLIGITENGEIIGHCDFWNQKKCEFYSQPISINSYMANEYVYLKDIKEIK